MLDKLLENTQNTFAQKKIVSQKSFKVVRLGYKRTVTWEVLATKRETLALLLCECADLQGAQAKMGKCLKAIYLSQFEEPLRIDAVIYMP